MRRTLAVCLVVSCLVTPARAQDAVAGVRAWLEAQDDAGREKALAGLASLPVPAKAEDRARLLNEALGRTKLAPHSRTTEKVDAAGEKWDVWVGTPRDYDPARQYPVVLSLCGWGMDGQAGLLTFSIPDEEWALVEKQIRAEAKKRKGVEPDKVNRIPPRVPFEHAIVVAPSWIPGKPTEEPPIDRTLAICLAALRKVGRELSIDPDRVIAAGFSRGGAASRRMASLRPDLFAGVVVMGSGGDLEFPPIANLRPLEVYLIHGDKDDAVPHEFGQKTHERLDREGVKNTFVTVPGLAHKWPPTDKNGPLVDWMKARARTPWPASFEHKFVIRDEPRRVYWLELPPGGESAVSVKTDTATNMIDLTIVKAPNVKSLTLHLGEPLVDLEKEVVVRSGDRTLFEGKVERRWNELLADLVRERYDVARAAPGRVELTLGD